MGFLLVATESMSGHRARNGKPIPASSAAASRASATRAGRGGRSNYNWKVAINQVDVMFPGRLDNP